MGVHLHLHRVSQDRFFEVTGQACETAQRLPRLSFEVPDRGELPADCASVADALRDHWRGEWAARHAGAVLAPWDHSITESASESLYLGKTWDALQILFNAEEWGGERVESPASAGPLSRAVFGTHRLPPALDQLLDFPIRYNLPDETGAMEAALREADLRALMEAVPRETLPPFERRVLEDIDVETDAVDELVRFYERTGEAGQVVVCVLS